MVPRPVNRMSAYNRSIIGSLLAFMVLAGAWFSLLVPYAGDLNARAEEVVGPKQHIGPAAGPDSRFGWNVILDESYEFALNSSADLQLDYDPVNNRFDRTGTLDPYLDHNSTVRAAIDRAPQWLNLTLSWRFHELNRYYINRYIGLLSNTSIDSRYMDELAFMIAFLPVYFLDSYWVIERLLLENVHMMYYVSGEVGYADIIDVQRSDGQHSTVVYSTPTGNVTLPEEIYYWYLVMPRSELETPSYIDLTTYRKTIEDDGAFWRSFLYTADDPGYPVLRKILQNQTTLWNGTKNQMEGNGAVGAVTFWANRCMMFHYEEGMRRDHQPVSLYKQHFGLCGENAEVLVAAAKTALIPAVVTITFEAMHAWNEFYERGWHQWQAYSGHIDDPMAEGAPGSVSVFTSFNGDMSQFSATPTYTTTTTLKVRVKDAQGLPVDGAMVRLTSQPMVNDPYIIPLIGNLTDVRGETTFVVGSGKQYFLQVLSPIGMFGNGSDPLVLAFPVTPAGQTVEFNATLKQMMPLKADLSGPRTTGTAIAFRATLKEATQHTRAWTDPLNFEVDHWRSYPDRTSLTLYFLDSENLTKYREGSTFRPGGVLTLHGNTTGTVMLGPGRDWTVVAAGLSQPLTCTKARLGISVLSPVPSVRILSPLPGKYSSERPISFLGILEPPGPYLKDMSYIWTSDLSAEPLSNDLSFSTVLGEGDQNITFMAWNDSGIVSRAHVDISVVRPNHPPFAVISSPGNGSVFPQGNAIRFSSNGSYDPDGDPLDVEWSEEGGLGPLSVQPFFERAFTVGIHKVTLKVSDPFQLVSTACVTFTVMPMNNPPVPYIRSPQRWTIHPFGEPLLLSANGTFDIDEDPLTYSWSSDMDGHLSSQKEGYVLLSKGAHTITLSVSDGTDVREAYVSIEVAASAPPTNRPPVAVMSSPRDGESFYASDDIPLASEGSFDPEGGPLTFLWSVNGGPVSDAASTVIRPGGGVWTVTLRVSDGELNATVSVSLVVYDRPPVVVLKVNGTIWQKGDEIRSFEGDTMVLNASGSYDPDGTDLSYSWSINGAVLSTGAVWARNFSADLHLIELKVTDEGLRSDAVTLQLRSLSRGAGPVPPDEGPGPKKEGFPLLAIISIVVIVLSAAVIATLFVLSRRLKASDITFEE